MPKTSIYLPEDLADQVRAHGISISEVAQSALRQAIKTAQIKENVMTDIQAVADRLRETRRLSAEQEREKDVQIHAEGIWWASTRANAEDLEYIATFSGTSVDYYMPGSLAAVLAASASEHRNIPLNPDQKRWEHFQAGAREVWDAVQPMLAEIDEHGQAAEAGSGSYSETVNPDYQIWLSREPGAAAPASDHDRWAAEQPAEFL
jgi:hypothetical protein